MPDRLAVASSVMASTLRAWAGTSAFRPAARQPQQLLELYDFEACPYCRLVREALTALDLDALIKPCPRRGERFRPQARELAGRSQFPLLVDPNTDTVMLESADIVQYLARAYEGRAPAAWLRPLRLAGGNAASLSRGLRGMRARPSRAPQQPLELFSFESSPFSRLVREVLCELELPYLLRNTGKARWEDMGPPWVRRRLFPDTPVEGRNRTRLLQLTGRVQVPYLVDPNSDTQMFESAAIITYLERSYAA